MASTGFPPPPGGHPPQTAALTGRAVFTPAYAVIPHGVMRDIVTSFFPGWENTRAWVLARPLGGFAETFSQILLDIAPGGGSDRPETEAEAEGALYLLAGALDLAVDGTTHLLEPGAFAYLPPGAEWRIRNSHQADARAIWIRKRWQPAPGLSAPPVLVTHEREHAPRPMPDTDGAWTTTRFLDPADMRHDMHVNIVAFRPGAVIPFEETHVMEHGIFILEGRGLYLLNRDWVPVEAGDFLWLRAFCPQACQAAGPGPFRYLLYKDVNRLPPLGPARGGPS